MPEGSRLEPGRPFDGRDTPLTFDVEAAFDLVTSSLYIVDRDLRIVLWNRHREQGPEGIPRAQALGRRLDEVLPPQGLRVARAAIERVFITGMPHEEITEAAVGLRSFRSRRVPLGRASEVTHVLSLFEEVTDARERKRVQQALEDQQAFLRLVIDLSPNLIFAKDREGRFTLVNQAVADVYGTTVDGLLGKTEADFNGNAEEVEAFLRNDLAVMESLAEKIIPEEVITDAAGRRRWLQTVKRPIVGADGVARQLLGVSTDITERKRTEEQLRQALKLEAVGRLAGGVAHDFNNILGVILGYGSMVLRRLQGDPDLREKVQQIVRAAERAASLTQQLLAFSRKQVLQPRTLDVNDVVEDLAKMLQRLIGEDVRLVTVLRAGLHSVMVDPGQVDQVLMNLAANARDAMPQGGQLTIETSNVELDGGYVERHPEARTGRHVLIAVTDTGVGIGSEELRHVFEPFFTTKDRGKGTGLGLSTVYGIVKQSGGHIGVYSEVGHGTTFKIYLPASDEAAAKAEAAPDEEHLTGSETILVAEDEEPLRELCRELLEERGYKVLAAASGAAALRALKSFGGPVQLVVTDVVMPDMGGRELFERVEAEQPQAKVLFVSGYADDAIVRHGVLRAGLAFLQKPFTPGALLRKIRQVLDARG